MTNAAQNKWKETGEMAEPQEPTQRLTAEIPTRLHQLIKVDAVTRGVKLKDLLTEILENAYAQNRKAA